MTTTPAETEIPLFTARWTDLYRAGVDAPVMPVCTSVGRPRFWPEAKGLPAVAELAPYGLMKVEDMGEFTDRYLARLEKTGVEKIRERFAAIFDEYQRPLALLCFEDVWRKRQSCHRRIFAAWYEDKTGQEIPELDPATLPGYRV